MADRPPASPAPVVSLRAEHAGATRQALVEQARKAFSEAGYQEASIEAVARSARVSKGALYHHFRDKSALLDAVVEQMQAGAGEEVRARAKQTRDPWAQLTVSAETLLEIYRRPAYRRVVLEDAPAVLGKARCAEIDDAHAMGFLKERIEALQNSGRLAPVSASILGAMLGAMIGEGAALVMASEKRGDAGGERVRAVVRTFLEAFKQEKA